MCYRFGPFTLNAEKKLLLYEESGKVGRLPLLSHPRKVLLLLIETAKKDPGQILSHEVIFSTAWEKDPGSKGNQCYKDLVYRAVADIRYCLGDHKHDYVEGASGEGYRFVHPVTEETIPSVPGPLPPRRDPLGKESPRKLLTRFGKIRSVADRLLLYLVLAKKEDDFKQLGQLSNQSEEELAMHLLTLLERIMERREDDFKQLGQLSNQSEEELAMHLLTLLERIMERIKSPLWTTLTGQPVKAVQPLIAKLKAIYQKLGRPL